MRGLAVGFRSVNQGIVEHELFTPSADGCRMDAAFSFNSKMENAGRNRNIREAIQGITPFDL
jgi:hypothetical protein